MNLGIRSAAGDTGTAYQAGMGETALLVMTRCLDGRGAVYHQNSVAQVAKI